MQRIRAKAKKGTTSIKINESYSNRAPSHEATGSTKAIDDIWPAALRIPIGVMRSFHSGFRKKKYFRIRGKFEGLP